MTKTVLEFGGYASRVLDVIKAKFGLKTKGEALDKFAEIYGDEFVEREPKDEYIRKILAIEDKHFKKYSYKKMTKKELDELFA